MKLLTIDSREVTGRPGVLLNSGDILDLAAAPSTLSESQWIPHSVVSVIAAGRDGLERVERLVEAAARLDREHLLKDGALLPYSGTALLAPVRRPGLVLVVDSDGPAYIKSPNAATGNGATVKIPWPGIDMLWGTPMISMVIGRTFFKADPAEAADAIAGYTLVADLSCREPAKTGSRSADRQYIESTQFPGAFPIGPTIVTLDEFGDPALAVMDIRINDVAVGSGALWPAGLDAGTLLSALSQRYGFRPGDLVAVAPGSDGVGTGRKLHPGDRFSIDYPGMIEMDVTVS